MHVVVFQWIEKKSYMTDTEESCVNNPPFSSL